MSCIGGGGTANAWGRADPVSDAGHWQEPAVAADRPNGGKFDGLAKAACSQLDSANNRYSIFFRRYDGGWKESEVIMHGTMDKTYFPRVAIGV